MKILIDIGHPAHVHYFRNFIKIMKRNGHEFRIIARDKEIVHYLLSKYNLIYFSRGKGSKSFIGKILYLLKGDFILLKNTFNYKPDVVLSFASPYAAHASKLLNIPHITLDDTEHAKFGQMLYVPFSKVILTPKNFRKNFGEKQIYFNGNMDLTYLHKNYFKPDPEVLSNLALEKNEKLIFIRFVAWEANHDIGYNKLNLNEKIKLVEELSHYGKIIISSESKLPEKLDKYKTNFPLEKVHSLLYYTDIFIGDSTSMATEAAILGTPAICINEAATQFGVFEDYIKFNLIELLTNSNKVIERTKTLLNLPNNISFFSERLKNFLNNKIDVTAFMVWFVENYPDSFTTMKENPDYQYNFK